MLNTCNFHRKFRFRFSLILSLRMRQMCILEKLNFKTSWRSIPPDLPSVFAPSALDPIFARLTMGNSQYNITYFNHTKNFSFFTRKGCTFRIIQRYLLRTADIRSAQAQSAPPHTRLQVNVQHTRIRVWVFFSYCLNHAKQKNPYVAFSELITGLPCKLTVCCQTRGRDLIKTDVNTYVTTRRLETLRDFNTKSKNKSSCMLIDLKYCVIYRIVFPPV